MKVQVFPKKISSRSLFSDHSSKYSSRFSQTPFFRKIEISRKQMNIFQNLKYVPILRVPSYFFVKYQINLFKFEKIIAKTKKRDFGQFFRYISKSYISIETYKKWMERYFYYLQLSYLLFFDWNYTFFIIYEKPFLQTLRIFLGYFANWCRI